jgi:hypothetical protein
MIPGTVDSTTSRAEQRVFELLRSDPDTRGWTVLHSLGLSRRGRKPYGEIDFVVLIPERGIVCLEVKGGRVTCRDGIWRTQDRLGRESALTRSPFQQAREGMFAMRAAIRGHFPPHNPITETLVASAVVFPDVMAPPRTTEWESWECVDLRQLRDPISRVMLGIIQCQRERIGPAAYAPSVEATRDIRTFLRPDFDVVIARSTTIARSEERALRLTEEQFELLDSVDRNERCIVEGAAGTGKTLLALEYARRCGTAGRRTLLVCYNRVLADWLVEQADTYDLGNMLVVGSYHSRVREAILASSYSDEFQQRTMHEAAAITFNEMYPFYGELALGESGPTADVVIIDEAQDFTQPSMLSVVNAWLRGGLAGGRWCALGDFTRQALYRATPREVERDLMVNDGGLTPEDQIKRVDLQTLPSFAEMMNAHTPHFTTLILRRNCRNTRKVGEETALLSGFKSLPYRLDGQESLAVDYRWWRTVAQQAEYLRAALAMLLSDGVKNDDIVILSPSRFDRSVASELTSDPKYPVVPLDEWRRSEIARRRTIPFSTIHAFKGMESPIVILCDIDNMHGDAAEALLYVGMSRARSHLIVLLHERLRSEVQTAVQKRLQREWST